MDMHCTLDTHQKALAINLDDGKYGTIAEIGAGQETARWFFQVGGEIVLRVMTVVPLGRLEPTN